MKIETFSIPDEWKPLLDDIASSFSNKSEMYRQFIAEACAKRGYELPIADVRPAGGRNLSSYITQHGWINEQKIARDVYGLPDLHVVDQEAHELAEYPLLQQAQAHNHRNFDAVFADRDIDESSDEYQTYLRETGQSE